jgi:hypothetical protein
MKRKHSTNSKNSIKNVYIILFVCAIIGISLYGCKKDEPQQEGRSAPVSTPLEEHTPAEQAQAESAEEIQADNNIELLRWEEGKAGATTIATALRAYAAENGTNGNYNNITTEKLGLTPGDLWGKYFNINNYELSDVSFDVTRTGHPLHYTITVTRPNDNWNINSFKLLHTGQWIQTP